MQSLSKSEKLYERALNVMPGGCSRNAILRKPHPLYAREGDGCYLIDIDGKRRIDFANNMAAHIHGHAHPRIVEAVSTQISKGTGYTFGTEVEIQYAEYIVTRNASFEKVRFVNSGTEAVMGCLKAARAFTGRPKIAKVEGAYHGLYDFAEVSQTANPQNWGDEDKPNSVPVAHGTPQSALNDVVVVPYNQIDRSIGLLEKDKDQIACILIDLMPHRVALHPATKAYVNALAKWANKNNVLIVCDEVITFRSNYGGAQDWYDIIPDLTALGKMIGGGFPVGAIVGRKEVMEVMNPLVPNVLFPHSGTFSANPVTMTAGLTAMKMFDPLEIKRLNALGDYAREQLTEAIDISGVAACVAGGGSMFRVHLKESIPENYREAYQTPAQKRQLTTVLNYFFDHGISLMNTCSGALSTVMTETEIDYLAEMLVEALRRL